ncbi:hypothetical protein BCR35DRAFT_301984 [Leucosporidium creatinivorum]|uniref:RNA helicase n=1 Tax=Leucosporidium creatinivorum TaxID=106004 RepID=A0A1Y2FVP5_9BASI|nr:hypothetical protein BCR35DRAFT_301984 [Leucosporidium creatinivorum]
MARSPSPAHSSSSKRRRYDDGGHSSSSRGDRDRGSSRRDRSRDRDSHRDSRRDSDRTHERTRERPRASDYDRAYGERDSRGGDRTRDRDHERESDRHRSSRHYSPREESSRPNGSSRRDRDYGREDDRDYRRRDDRRSDDHHSRREDSGRRHDGSPRSSHRASRSRSPDPRRYSPAAEPIKKPAFVSTFAASSAPPAPAASARTEERKPSLPPGSPLSLDSPKEGASQDEEKLRIKREKLAAWKAKKAAEAAGSPAASPAPASPKAAAPLPAKPAAPVKAGLPAKPASPTKPQASSSSSDPAALALAAAAAISNRLSSSSAPVSAPLKTPISASLPAKPTFSFNSTAFRPSGLKNSLKLGMGEDDDGSGDKKVGMLKFDDAVDMTVKAADEDDGDDEDLEGGASYKPKEGGRDARMAALMDGDTDMANGDDDEEDEKPEAKMDVDGDEEEEDELEAFMNNVQKQVKSVDKADKAKLGAKGNVLDPEAVEEEEDEAESEDELEKVGMSAAEILALAAKKVKRGRELTAIDHSKVSYEPFNKIFYRPPPEVEALTAEEVDEMRLEMDAIKVRGADPPKPVAKWSYCGLPAPCIDVIKGLEYTAPTSIQAQAIPAIMSGRDIIGVAKTGSGKTIAFLLPMFRHIKDQRPIRTMEGPIAMIMTPTRELATQIHKECKPFLKALGLRASCAYGGTPLKDNIADMKRGSELIVCTPGRMIELLTTNSGRIINLHRVTYLVLDEADRMFDMGFEPQVMKIINQIRPDRQTVLFSATFPRQMEALARKILRRPLEITVGGRSIVAAEIEQIVEVRSEDSKFNRMLELLGKLFNEDNDARALIFVERQESADKLLADLLRKNYSCMSLHGGMEQVDRDQTIADFKTGVVPVVIATSVAARGLDVKQLKLVIQFDAPNHMEDYVHRAGRTGRAGNKGTCVTFLTPDQDRYSLDIFKALQASGAAVPDDVKAMAEGFAEKVKAGKASGAGSGFGGKGLERLDTERDAQSRAERAAYGEPGVEKKAEGEGATGEESTPQPVDVADLEVEIRRGPAPDTNKTLRGGGGAAATTTDSAAAAAAGLEAAKAAEAAALAAGKSAGAAKAQSVIANFNAMLKAKSAARSSEPDHSTDAARRRDPDATDYHAIIYINDYPQKARWKVTNKDTMVQLVESTGASITNKGVYYEPGKEPGPDELPKLHLLIESNEEFRVKHAISEIKRALIEGATLALEAEQRQPAGTGPTGRYTV